MKSVQGWKNNIKTFRAVPDNSLIFEFCKSGNIAGVRSLLSRGEGSPLDTNSLGWTPLHIPHLGNHDTYPEANKALLKFASWCCNIELYKLVLKAGADKEALTYDFPGGNYEVW
ncbi:hypothetical protein HYFRA_00010651 [Hymenoscyphus fraxineus]|uniref:Ankyrin repeat protein n=1 Tax=Hymenoscyphus fraxineus TaxID=746836 RepID=A0A9N9PZX3_9HELO|nr:hypothetical protein HYFRA_00010651 [Hymenoscyphus fraxineus]